MSSAWVFTHWAASPSPCLCIVCSLGWSQVQVPPAPTYWVVGLRLAPHSLLFYIVIFLLYCCYSLSSSATRNCGLWGYHFNVWRVTSTDLLSLLPISFMLPQLPSLTWLVVDGSRFPIVFWYVLLIPKEEPCALHVNVSVCPV